MAWLLLFVVIVYSALVAFLYVNQRRLMYLPDKALASAEQYGLEGFADRRVQTEDGLAIQLWHRPAAPGFPTVAYFHGNASHIGNRAGIFAALASQGFGVMALSYRGYGRSEGSPTEQGLYADARAALAYLTGECNIPLGRILLYGESLGTGVAVQMASEHPVGGLILQAPYKSVVGRAAEIYFYIPVRLLIHDHYDSLEKMSKVRAPVMIFHGELDEVIPVAHGRAMFEAAAAPKRGLFLPHVNHNDFDSAAISAHVSDFAREHRLID